MSKLFKCLIFTFISSLFVIVTAYASSVEVTYSGYAEPGSLVSFLLTGADVDYANVSGDDIIHTEIVVADEEGNFSQTFKLNNPQYDSNGNIINYKLKSNIEGININSGSMAEKAQVTEVKNYDGVMYVPMISTLEKLGIKLEYDSKNDVYTGIGNNGEITISVGKNTMVINYVTIELPGKVILNDEVIWIPLYAIEDIAKVPTPEYDLKEGIVYVDIPDPNQAAPDDFSIGDVVKDITGSELFNQNEVYKRNAKISNACGASISVGKTEVSGQSFKDALRITETYTQTQPSDYVLSDLRLTWNAYLGTLAAGEVGVLSFKARALDCGDADFSTIKVYYQKNNGTAGNGLFEKALSREVEIRKGDWQQFYLPVYHSTYSMDKTYSSFMIYVGGQNMDIEIADISLINYKNQISYEDVNPDAARPYKGMEDDALWRKEAYRRIEKYRKEDVSIQVNDINGNPIKDAVVSVDMTNNEFMFGVSLLKREVVGLDTSTKSGKIYNDLLNNDFNAAVCGLEMKQNGMTNSLGADAVEMANEFFSRNMRMRGHAIFWDDASTVAFGDYNNMTYEQIYSKMIDYAGPVAQMFKGKLAQWDVVNEPTDSNHTRTQFNTTRLYTDLFNLIHKIDPDVKLYVNETGIEGSNGAYIGDRTVKYIDFVNRLKKEGAHIDGMGIQAHCTNYYYPQGFYNQLDACAQIVDEVSVTEYDFLNANMTYADEHLRDTLIATFSQPKATAFIVWGVQDTEHWRRSAPFYDSGWNEKDAKKVWSNLVNNEFATHEKLVTNGDGIVNLRAFRGDYNVKVSVGGKTETALLKVVHDSDNSVVFTVGLNGISSYVSNETNTEINKMDYENLDEAKAVYEGEHAEKYTGMLLDTNFKGAEGESAVINGNALTNSNYNSGRIWGSVSGNSSSHFENDKNSLVLCSDKILYNTDIRHKTFASDRYPDTDLYFETMFETMSSNVAGEYAVELNVSGNECESLAKMVYDNGLYCLKFSDGTSYALSNDTPYKIGFMMDRNGNIVKCTLYNEDEVEKTFCIVRSKSLNIDTVDEVIYKISSGIAENENMFKMYNTRLCSVKDGSLIVFGSSDRELYAADESMKNFDYENILYLDEDSLKNYAGDSWVRAGGTYGINEFKYENNGQYLYTVIKNAGGTQSLIKNFEPLSDGESMTFEYDMYLNGAAKWYDLSGSGTISLGSSDSDYKIDITSFYYDKYRGYKLKILSENQADYLTTEDVHNGITEGYNWTDLTVSANFVFVGNNSYDITITIKDKNNNILKTITENGISQDKVKGLNRIFITAYSQYSSAGELNFCGVKNIKILKSGLTINDGEYKIVSGDTSLGIPYQNITGRAHDAKLIVAYYKDNEMKKVKILPCTIKSGSGSLNFNAGELSEDTDYCKVILVNSLQDITPYRGVDVISIK